MKRNTIGLDLAKHVFQVHGIDESDAVIMRRRLRRSEVLGFFKALEPCLVSMEACATSHFWAREILALGHRAASSAARHRSYHRADHTG
jgi:transposase